MLVDEFQDTDPVQYAIFRDAFLDAPGSPPVYFIGDPKQSIYAFRGGDIHAYRSAAAAVPPDRRYTLGENHRSAPGLVAAVNDLFRDPGGTGPDAWTFGDGAIPYPGTIRAGSAKADLADGATILVPDDESNQTRALLLLQQEDLIVLPEGSSVETAPSILDIVDAKGYNIQAAQADAVPSLLLNSGAGSIAVINYNYALGAGFKTTDALAIEDASGSAAQTYGNIVAVRRGDDNEPAILALVAALQDGAVERYNEQTGAGIVATK